MTIGLAIKPRHKPEATATYRPVPRHPVHELRHLRYFKAVVESGGISASARRLHIVASAIGDTMRDLEDELGVKLFDRKSRRLALTSAGASFLDDATRLLAQTEDAIERVRRLDKGEIGQLRIGFFSGAFGTFSPRLIGQFRRRHKGISIHLNEMVPAAQIEAVLSGSIDVGFTRPCVELRVPDLVSEHFQTEQLFAVLPQTHRLARHKQLHIGDLADDRFVINERKFSPGLHDRVLALCFSAGFTPTIASTASASIGVAALVEAGEGVAVLSQPLRAAESTLRFLPITDQGATIDIVVAWSRRNQTPTLHAFLQHVRSNRPQRRTNSFRNGI